MKPSVALVAVGLALAAAGCFGDDDDDDEAPQGRAQTKLVSTTAVEGGSRRDRALLRRVLDGMPKTTLKRIQLVRGEAPEGDAPPALAVVFTAEPGPSIRRQWDEWIVAGAFSRRLAGAGLPAKIEASGKNSFTASPKLPGQPDPRPLSPARETAVVRAIRNAARRSGGDIVRLEIDRPYGVAVALSLESKNPASFLKTKLRPLLTRLGAHRQRLEGLYLAVLDERRRLVLEWGSWTRNRAGTYWVRRDLAECSPIEQSAPPGTEPPPPCPA